MDENEILVALKYQHYASQIQWETSRLGALATTKGWAKNPNQIKPKDIIEFPWETEEEDSGVVNGQTGNLTDEEFNELKNRVKELKHGS